MGRTLAALILTLLLVLPQPSPPQEYCGQKAER